MYGQVHCEDEIGCQCPKLDCLDHSKIRKCRVLDATHNYSVCVDSLKTLQNLCQRSCGDNNLICESACFDKYGSDLQACPCQVKKHSNKRFKFCLKIHCEKGCSCPKYDCLSIIKNETLALKTTGIFVPKPAKKLSNNTTVQTTSKGNLQFFA